MLIKIISDYRIAVRRTRFPRRESACESSTRFGGLMFYADMVALGSRQRHVEQNAAIRFGCSRLVIVAKEAAGLTEAEASKAPLLDLRSEELVQACCKAAAGLAAKLVNVDAQSRPRILPELFLPLGGKGQDDRALLTPALSLNDIALALERNHGLRDRALGRTEITRQRRRRIREPVGAGEITQGLPLSRIEIAVVLGRPHEA